MSFKTCPEKKRDAWLLHSADGKKGSDDALKLQCQCLCKLTKAAAEKVRYAWWSARAVETGKHALATEPSGRSGSLIRERQLLKRSASKPSTSTMLVRACQQTLTSYNYGCITFLKW